MQPYLGKRAHLSLSWLSHPLLSLILVIISLLLLLNSIDSFVSSTKAALLSDCSKVEGGMEVVSNLPHYTADSINDLNKKAVINIIKGTGEVLDLALLGIEGIALFIIEMYRSLFLCILNLAVHGSLDLLIAATSEAQSFVITSFNASRVEIQNSIALINSGLAKIPLVHISPLPMPALSSLSNVTLPSSILQSLQALNTSLPTLNELRASLDTVISAPITSIRKQISATVSNSTNSIAIQQLPVPPLITNSGSYCKNMDASFVDAIGRDLIKSVKIGLFIILGLIILLFIAGALWSNYQYNSHLRGVKRAKESWQNDLNQGTDSLSISNLRAFLAASQHPTLHMIISDFCNHFNLSSTTRTKLYWFGNYIFHPSALTFLVIGVLGLFFIQIQLALLAGPLKLSAQRSAANGLTGFSANIIADVNSKMNLSSTQYANKSNLIVSGYENSLNHDLFGWINSTTTTLNTTIETFYTGLTTTVHQTFAGTPFDRAALDLINCLIGSKVVAISKALTFLNNNSHITLPRVSPSVLLLSPNRTAELTSSISNSTAPGGGINGVVEGMIGKYEKVLIAQRIGFFICIGIWFIVLVFGILGICWRESKEEKVEEIIGEKKYKDLKKFNLGKEKFSNPIPLSNLHPTRSISPPQYMAAPIQPNQTQFIKPTLPLPASRPRAQSIKRFRVPQTSLSSCSFPSNFRFNSPSKPKVKKRDSSSIGLTTGSYSPKEYPGAFKIENPRLEEEGDQEREEEEIDNLGPKVQLYQGFI